MKRVATKTAEAPPVNGTSEHQSLSKYIQARFDECSRSQKDVAQYIVDHLDEAAFQTAEELARRANTSSSTVVRFSQALGFEGFPELQQAARDAIENQLSYSSDPSAAVVSIDPNTGYVRAMASSGEGMSSAALCTNKTAAAEVAMPVRRRAPDVSGNTWATWRSPSRAMRGNAIPLMPTAASPMPAAIKTSRKA